MTLEKKVKFLVSTAIKQQQQRFSGGKLLNNNV
jgi:hypothetical protein